MTHSGAGGRRLDRVLAADYLDGLAQRPLPQVRELRAEAEQEEADLSYLRRLLQGRVDILRAELARRRGSEPAGSLVDALPGILADAGRPPARGLGRHVTVEPSRADAHRRRVEALAADVDLSDPTSRTDEQVRAVLEMFEREEREVSAARRRVQDVMDACTAELTRRYRDGQADVSALLDTSG